MMQPFFYYSTRNKLTDINDISQYRLNNGSIFLSNSDADRAANIYPSGFIYHFKINPFPKTAKFKRDTSDYDRTKVIALIRNSPNYQAAMQKWGDEAHFIKHVFSKERQGAVYHSVYENLYIGNDVEYAKGMVSLGWAGFFFKVTEPDLIHGAKAREIKIVSRLWNPKYLELLEVKEWSAKLS